LELRWIALIISLLIPAALACALVSIQWKYRRIRSWQETTGRIEQARSVPREIRSKRFRTVGSRSSTDFITDETVRTGNLAKVSDSFAVGPLGRRDPEALSARQDRHRLLQSGEAERIRSWRSRQGTF
jgi:hypothetical protein